MTTQLDQIRKSKKVLKDNLQSAIESFSRLNPGGEFRIQISMGFDTNAETGEKELGSHNIVIEVVI